MNKLNDLEIIREQIERVPEGFQEVVFRDSKERPAVIRVASLVREAPFPTFLWLTSPEIGKQVNTIESLGTIKKWEREIKADSLFAEAVFKSHQRYSERRKSFLTLEEEHFLDKVFKDEKSFHKLGVGGVSDWQTIRCLHMHLADFLVYGDNAVGKRLMETFSLKI
jgi:uncharacterized protein